MPEILRADGTLTPEAVEAINSWEFSADAFAAPHGNSPVLIEWVDSHVATTGWQILDEFTPTLPTARSVGWITHQDERCVTVAPHVIDAHDPSVPAQVCGVMVIPRAAIKSVVRLEPDHA